MLFYLYKKCTLDNLSLTGCEGCCCAGSADSALSGCLTAAPSAFPSACSPVAGRIQLYLFYVFPDRTGRAQRLMARGLLSAFQFSHDSTAETLHDTGGGTLCDIILLAVVLVLSTPATKSFCCQPAGIAIIVQCSLLRR